MKINRQLDQLFANGPRVQILRTLFGFPGEFTGRHISRLSGLPHATTRLNLKTLEETGILNVKYAGKSKLFSLNKDNILFKPLFDLFAAEQSVITELKNKLIDALSSNREIRNALVHASIYGSVAKSDERFDSDIDVFLVFARNVHKNKLDATLESLEDEVAKRFGNYLHVSYWFQADKSRQALPSPNLLNEISQHGITIYGKDLKEILDLWQKE